MCKQQTQQKPDAVGVAVEPEVRLCEICNKEIKYDSISGCWKHVDAIFSHLPEVTEEISPEEQEWLNKLAKECNCCEQCCGKPCEGLMAGGFCDEMCLCDFECNVDDDDDFEFNDE